ncbi:MAG: RidA family protein [Lachnospiraceae bacterium]|nr:RidA family protein [Lachnospiraceae bacterium]
MSKKIISTDKAPAAIGPYSQAVEAGGFIYASGQIPIDPATGNIPEGIEAQAKQALTNVKNLIEAAGLTLDDVVKTSVFIKDMGDFAKVNEIYATFFTKDYPARSCVEVARLPKDVLIEVEVVAARR